MEITSETLQTVYQRAMQYCVAKFGSEPSRLCLLENGSFEAIWSKQSRGEWYEDEEYFNADCLTQDLDEVYKERKDKEEKERIKREEEQKILKRINEKRDKQQRKEQYEKGYFIENSLTCCSNCNYAKKNMLYDEFLDWVKRVYNHLNLKQNNFVTT